MSFLKVTIPPHPAKSGRCHGGSQNSPLHGEGIFLPSRYAKPRNTKPIPQGTRTVTKGSCEQPLLSPCGPTGAQGSSIASGYRNGVDLLLLLNCILCLHKVSVTQTQFLLSLPSCAALGVQLPPCTAAGAARTENTCHRLKHLSPARQEFPLGCCFTCTALLSPLRSGRAFLRSWLGVKLKTAPSSSLL